MLIEPIEIAVTTIKIQLWVLFLLDVAAAVAAACCSGCCLLHVAAASGIAVFFFLPSA